MKIAVANEIEICERRVALIPDTVARLVKKGWEVWVESGAGERAFFTNADYEAAGAVIRRYNTVNFCSTSPSGVNQVDGSPPAAKFWGRSEWASIVAGAYL